MEIRDIKTNKLYYSSKKGSEVFFVSSKFWRKLKTSGLLYVTGDVRNGVRYTKIVRLKLSDPEFELIFSEIARSELGKEVMTGELPTDTIL